MLDCGPGIWAAGIWEMAVTTNNEMNISDVSIPWVGSGRSGNTPWGKVSSGSLLPHNAYQG